ncbi:hypothetical protein L916_04952, partial [Phytophthora nicotianae]
TLSSLRSHRARGTTLRTITFRALVVACPGTGLGGKGSAGPIVSARSLLAVPSPLQRKSERRFPRIHE